MSERVEILRDVPLGSTVSIRGDDRRKLASVKDYGNDRSLLYEFSDGTKAYLSHLTPVSQLQDGAFLVNSTHHSNDSWASD
jgi:hypothetical protein